MGWVTGAGIVITSLHVGFADLPKEVNLPDGNDEYVTRSVSEFYDQEVPNILVGGYYAEGNTTVSFGIDSGTHTKKLDTYGLNVGVFHTLPIADSNSDITFGAKISADYIENRPCIDSFYDRKFYCGNLTPWKTFEGKTDVQINPSLSINYTLRF